MPISLHNFEGKSHRMLVFLCACGFSTLANRSLTGPLVSEVPALRFAVMSDRRALRVSACWSTGFLFLGAAKSWLPCPVSPEISSCLQHFPPHKAQLLKQFLFVYFKWAKNSTFFLSYMEHIFCAHACLLQHSVDGSPAILRGRGGRLMPTTPPLLVARGMHFARMHWYSFWSPAKPGKNMALLLEPLQK